MVTSYWIRLYSLRWASTEFDSGIMSHREPMPEPSSPTGAVFISYASQDAEAALRICEALRAAGAEVWFDQSELRGGDSWDAQIKRHIHDCVIFIPVISAHTNARSEGYFRREWKLATRRLMDIADDAAFLMPVVIDETREANARVPEEFLQAQWTWLRDGDTPPAFAQRVQQLLGGKSASVRHSQAAVTGAVGPSARSRFADQPWLWFASRGRHRTRNVGIALAALLLVLGGGAFWYHQGAKKVPAVIPDPVAKFSPPAHSVAVLAFTNMSGDPKDEYFSDGLSEELLNTLVRVKELKVAARTSSFTFKGGAVDIPTVGRKLNVGAVLEGSVRRVGERVRITAQLINTVTGYHMWSETYDRDVNDILALQTEIATKVATELQIAVFNTERKRLTEGGTNNPAAFDAYLRGRQQDRHVGETSLRAAIALYDEAIKQDPNFGSAHAARADALRMLAGLEQGSRTELKAKALASAEKAVEVAPTWGNLYAVLGSVVMAFGTNGADLARAEAIFNRGLAVAPGNASLLTDYSYLAAILKRPDAIAAARQAAALNPLDPYTYDNLSHVLEFSHRFDEARIAMDTALTMQDSVIARGRRGIFYIEAGRPEAALTDCEIAKDEWIGQLCLAIAYHQLGRKREATAVANRIIEENGNAGAFQYAQIYAQWGQKETAIKWLDTALRLQDPALLDIQVDPLVDPLRDEPQFKQIVDELNFPK